MGIFKQNIIMINIVLFGKPGAGKGTQAEFLKIKYNLIHISTGDLFRNNITEKTTLGILAKSYMDKGNLVPDQVTIDMLEAEVDKNPQACPHCMNTQHKDNAKYCHQCGEILNDVD